MALTTALNTTIAGLQLTESRINVLSSNVTNADKPGYTRKELETTYTTVGGYTVPLKSTLETVNFNPYLLESIIEDTANASYHGKIADYFENYMNELGTIDGDNSLSALANDLATALDRLSITPEDTSLRYAVIVTADRLATELRRLSGAIQGYRLQVDENIEQITEEINASVQKIFDMNYKVTQIDVNGDSTANLMDERNTELEKLSKLIDINYYTNSQGQVQIYTAGRPLLDSKPRVIDYEANTNLTASTVYPGGFNAIDLDGFDITSTVKTGEMASLITLRDSMFVQEQAKLDQFASVMIDQINTVLNTGASLPPRPDMIGDTLGLVGTTALGGPTGLVRIATTDQNGVIQNFADIDLSLLSDVDSLIAAINGALGPDVTASLTADGALSLVANNAGEGLALNQLDSDFAGDGFSKFFGLNNMFKGADANTIYVSDYLMDDAGFLATSSLDGGAGLAIGDAGVFIGANTITNALNNAFTTNYSFAAAGNFSAQTDSLIDYVDKFIADAAYRTNTSRTNEEIATTLMQQTKSTLENMSAVNVDEEMANLIDLQAKYEASAAMIRTLQDMFDALLSAVR